MGLLISIEGGEYTGKSSVIVPYLKDRLQKLEIPVLTSREPGGTPEGEKMREQIFTRLKEGASAEELAELLNKARRLHVNEVIIPFLGEHKEKKAIVVLDRYLDSTVVYQGLEGGVQLKRIFEMEKQYVNDYYPDLTLITFFPENNFKVLFKEREKKMHKMKNVWDESPLDVHLQRQRYYLQLPEIYQRFNVPRNFAFINASDSPTKVGEAAFSACIPYIKKAGFLS